MLHSVFRGQGFRRVAVVKNDVRPAWQSGDKSERRPDGLLRQIGHNSEPGKKRLLRSVKARGCKSVPQRLSLEVDWCVGERVRRENRFLRQTLTLPGLRC